MRLARKRRVAYTLNSMTTNDDQNKPEQASSAPAHGSAFVDRTPLTEEWIISQGFARVESSMGPNYADHLEKDSVNVWEFNGQGKWLWQDGDRLEMKTRGEFRMFCALMKVRPLRRKRSMAETKKETDKMEDIKTKPQGAVEPASTGYPRTLPTEFYIQRRWREIHAKADDLIATKSGKVLAVLYRSPDERLREDYADFVQMLTKWAKSVEADNVLMSDRQSEP